MPKSIKRDLPLAFTLILLAPSVLFSQSSETHLPYCQNILTDLAESAYFSQDTSTHEFATWWKRKWILGRPIGIIKVDYELHRVEPIKEDGEFETYLLPGEEDISIALEVPVAKPKNEDDFVPECASNKSKLKSSKTDKGLLVDLNPYCSESYGPNEVDITLYWISINEKPLISISTNGPACIPAMLYTYNPNIAQYELAAEKCGG